MPDAVGIGALNLDLFYEVEDLGVLGLRGGREVCRGPHGFGELLGRVQVLGRPLGRSPGGSAANTIYALSRLGFETAFVGKVGEDPEGEEVLRGMAGVDCSQVKREGRTGLCLVVLDRRRDRALVVEPNANDALSPEDLDPGFISRFKVLHMSSFVGERPFEAQRRVVRELPKDVRVTLDPGELYARRGLGELEGLLKRCWAVFLTEEELRTLTGLGPEEGAKRILGLGVKWVICKRGPKGAVAFWTLGSYTLRAEPSREVVDNTGAGDVFDAGVLAGMLKGFGVEESLRLGHRLALKSLRGLGRECYPDEGDLCA